MACVIAGAGPLCRRSLSGAIERYTSPCAAWPRCQQRKARACCGSLHEAAEARWSKPIAACAIVATDATPAIALIQSRESARAPSHSSSTDFGVRCIHAKVSRDPTHALRTHQHAAIARARSTRRAAAENPSKGELRATRLRVAIGIPTARAAAATSGSIRCVRPIASRIRCRGRIRD